MFLLLFLIQSTLAVEVEDVVLNYLKTTTFAGSPCDDFYAHVCPSNVSASRYVRETLSDEYFRIVDSTSHPFLSSLAGPQLTKLPHFQKEDARLTNAWTKGDLLHLCLSGRRGFSLIRAVYDYMILRLEKRIPNQAFDCQKLMQQIEKSSLILGSDPVLHAFLASMITGVATVISDEKSLMQKINTATEHLFHEIIATAANEFENTPWIRNKGGLGVHQKFLKTIQSASVERYQKVAVAFFKTFKAAFDKCRTRLAKYSNGPAIICAPKAFLHAAVEGGPDMETSIQMCSIDSSINAANFNDVRIYTTTAIKFLSQTKSKSILMGTLGSTLSHELMHTFFISDHERQSPLYRFFTDSSQCVSRHYHNTCMRFVGNESRCQYGSATIEEDGADLSGIRLAYRVFQKLMQKTPTEQSPITGVSNEQMFFYAMASTWCLPAEKRMEHNEGSVHSLEYVRVNAMVSHIDEFRQAFGCKPTSPMVLAKLENCAIFGSEAPANRRKSASSSDSPL